MMPTLHVVNKSPEHPRFRACLTALGEKDTLLLSENGVTALVCSKTAPLLPSRTFALLADIEARGLVQDSFEKEVKVADYSTFVQLTTENPKIISW